MIKLLSLSAHRTNQYCMIFGLCMQAIFGFALSGAYNKSVILTTGGARSC